MVAEPFPGADAIGGALLQGKEPPAWAKANQREFEWQLRCSDAFMRGWLWGAGTVIVLALAADAVWRRWPW